MLTSDPVDQLQDTNFHRQSYHHWRKRLSPEEIAKLQRLVETAGVDTVLRAALAEDPTASDDDATRLAGFLLFLYANRTNWN